MVQTNPQDYDIKRVYRPAFEFALELHERERQLYAELEKLEAQVWRTIASRILELVQQANSGTLVQLNADEKQEIIEALSTQLKHTTQIEDSSERTQSMLQHIMNCTVIYIYGRWV